MDRREDDLMLTISIEGKELARFERQPDTFEMLQIYLKEKEDDYSWDNCKITYRDSDGEIIKIGTEAEYKCALEYARIECMTQIDLNLIFIKPEVSAYSQMLSQSLQFQHQYHSPFHPFHRDEEDDHFYGETDDPPMRYSTVTQTTPETPRPRRELFPAESPCRAHQVRHSPARPHHLRLRRPNDHHAAQERSSRSTTLRTLGQRSPSSSLASRRHK